MALTLVFFALSERYPERRRLFLVLMYVGGRPGRADEGAGRDRAAGAGVRRSTWRVRGELRRVTQMMIPLGIVIVAAIVVPWYAALYREHGWTYIKSFLISENVERFTQGVGVRQQRGPWFYLPVVLSDSFPWSLLLPCAAAAAWKDAHPDRDAALVLDRGDRRFLLAVGRQAGPLHLPDRARPWPRSAASRSRAAWRTRDGQKWVSAHARRRRRAARDRRRRGAVPVRDRRPRLRARRGADRRRPRRSPAASSRSSSASRGSPRPPRCRCSPRSSPSTGRSSSACCPSSSATSPSPSSAGRCRSASQPGDVVAHYQVSLPSMVYYLRRHVDQYVDDPPFVGAILSGRQVYAVLSADDYAALAPQIGARPASSTAGRPSRSSCGRSCPPAAARAAADYRTAA